MALVKQDLRAIVRIRDTGGNEASMSLVARGTDLNVFETYVTGTAVPAIEAITKGLVVSVSIGASYEEDTDVYPATQCEVENQALVVVRIEGEVGKTANLRIPAPVDGIFVGTTGEDYNTVDTGDADLGTFVGLWQDSLEGAGDSDLLLSDGERVDFASPIKAGKRIHRASRKG